MTILYTARLELRPLCRDDLDEVTALAADVRVMASLGGVLSAAESEAWLDRQIAHTSQHGYGRYAVLREREFIGCVGLTRTDFDRAIVPGIEVAWRLAFAHWHQGYATEAARAVIEQAFTEFSQSEVIAVTSADNARSRRVMDRLGMQHSPEDSFEHPALPEGHPLRKHVVYRLRRRSASDLVQRGP